MAQSCIFKKLKVVGTKLYRYIIFVLQIELQLLKDEKDREVQKVEDLKESKNSSQAALSAERKRSCTV